ncbi:hypothetical protein AU381_00155 [Sinorhizobium glycinis]|uniref:Methyltransferase n=1 Tax=Sinorhizobium glycinis TaxID=1472378 RepID=A0A178Y0W6_9HYPH|nr:hypothetical protein [Sinorhizobium glycinis]OAP40375.1 hypothetical protein AU381_00155 [Sinorhizobium glycinis]
MTVTASKYARAENDLYQTEPWVTEALIRNFPIDGMSVWEPAAGNHLMADVLCEAGARVTTSDIAVYGRRHDHVLDFLNFKPTAALFCPDGIITNPPYGKGNRDAVKFAERALLFCPGLVALLLTAKFDFGSTRQHLFQNNPRFAAKIALTDRISWTLDGVTGTEDHAWYVWTEKPRLPRAPVILYAGRQA